MEAAPAAHLCSQGVFAYPCSDLLSGHSPADALGNIFLLLPFFDYF